MPIDCAFYGCVKLASIVVPDNSVSVEEWAFGGCDGLVSVTISNSFTSISDYVFSGCNNLTSIKFKGTKEQWDTVSKRPNWNYNTGNYTIHCTDGDIEKA